MKQRNSFANTFSSKYGKTTITKIIQSHKFLCLLLCMVLIAGFAPVKTQAQWGNDDDYWQVTPFDAATGTIQIKILAGRYKKKSEQEISRDFIREAQIWRFSPSDSTPIQFIHLIHDPYERNYIKVDYTINDVKAIIVERDSSVIKKDIDGYDITFYWKIFTLSVTDYNKDIKRFDIDGQWVLSGGGGGTAYPINGHKDVLIPSMSNNFDFAPVTFITDGSTARALIGYRKNNMADIDKNAIVQLFYENGTPVPGQSGDISANYVYDSVATAATEQNYFYKEGIYFDSPDKYPYGRITTNSPTLKVPAFPLPGSMGYSYDAVTHTIKLYWDITPVTSGSYIKNDFKLQIASDPSFSNPIEKTITYNNTSNFFNYDITQDFSPHMYFRVSRDYNGSDWKLWDVAKTQDLYIVFSNLDLSKTSASLLPDKTAKIMWEVNPYAWVPGSSFIITKLNYTTGVQSEIKLGEAEFNNGFYIDKQIATCNEYHYTLRVIPPTGSLFTAYPPVEVKGSVLNPDIGKLLTMTASKGYFPERTQLNWQSTGAFDNFIVKRAQYGTGNYVQISTVQGSTDGNFQMDDDKGIPGVYYSYSIYGMINCNSKPVYSTDTLRAIGFRSPTGNIHGRVVYKNGQAVPGAVIRLQSEDAGQFGKSIYFNGSNSAYLSVDSVSQISDITTVETWIKPDDKAPANQVIINRSGQFELGFNAAGKLYFNANGSVAEGNYENVNQTFIHVAGVRTQDSVKIMVNDSVIAGIRAPYNQNSSPAKNLLIGASNSGKNFKGFVDEVLIWNKALSDSIIALNYDHLITGGENGLAAYWRFDESISDQFFDLSHNGVDYHKNDGIIHSGARHTDTIPTPGQLSFKSYTDTAGNYMISGIPYTGNGTIYQIVPTLSTHQFDPVSDSRFISENTSDFTVDFTDKSSFPVSGTIYYTHTTVPVPGVMFMIDGQYAQNGDGTLIQTDNEGNFNITVPVGIHRVQAVKSNHVFNQNGDILDAKGNYINYQSAYSGIQLRDSTTIRFIGRVAGGTIQAALPLGYSISRNNLGKNIKISMKLSGGSSASFSLYTGNAPLHVVVPHKQLSDPNDSGRAHKTTMSYYEDRIEIYPDSLTGEFAADIIPEKFYTDSIMATGWGNILSTGNKPPNSVQFDFTNKFINFITSYSYEDSVYKDSAHPDSGYVYNNYTDSVSYNDSALFIKRVNPSVIIAQTDGNGDTLRYFGDSTYEYQLINGTKITSKVVDLNKTGKEMYALGHPVFSQNLLYNFKISCFESYPYYETDNGTAIYPDMVPVTDGKILINNEIRDSATGTDALQFNSEGLAYYSFHGGDPDLSDALQGFSATVQTGQATFIPWIAYDGSPVMQVYNIGTHSTGTDFVTQGPNEPITVLRDPPGSRSFSYIEKNSTFSKTHSWSAQSVQEGKDKVTASLGPKLLTWLGVGAGTVMEVKTTLDLSLTIKHEQHWSSSHETSETNVITDRFQTSDDPAFVGELGDVFIGHSTNITYGTGSAIIIVNKNKDSLRVDDYIFDSTADYAVVKRTSLQIGQEFGTLFAFTQQYIQYQAIPHLRDFIKDVLSKYPVDLDSAAAQQAANSTNKPVYVSHLSADDKNFGKTNHDPVFGAGATKPYNNGNSYSIYFPVNSITQNDTIMTLNQYIKQWTELLRKNEEEKINSTLAQNYSFHAGSPIEHSEQMISGIDTSHSFNFIISAYVGDKMGVKVNDAGVEYEINEGLGDGLGQDSTQTHETTNISGFALASDGTDDYFSVDVKRANDSSGFVFITRGGESACPYEGGTVTKYYDSGKQLNYPTVQIEVPKFDVDTHEVNDVPSSRPAVFNLTLRNESEAKLPATYILGYVDNNSIKGATIAVDGVSIGGAGRPIVVQYGEEIKKVLTITKGPNAMNYDSIMILWHSACQYDPTSYLASIGDTQVIAAHFIPSCTDISLSAPAANWILNTKSPFDTSGIRFLPVIIDKFDTTNPLFDHIVLQYKPSSSDKWQSAATFYADSATLKAATGSGKYLITDPTAIHYSLDMDNTFFPDQGYDIQAVSTCVTGPGSTVVTLSNIVSGVKDTITPRLFGNPQPANGVLGEGDEIKLTFNEPIEAGLLSYNNFQVTGIKNLSQGDHSVSVNLDGENDYLSTEFAKNFTGKSITAEMWIKPGGTEGGTLFSQGNNTNSMELALTADKHLQVTIGDKTITSNNLDYSQDWAHVAMVYNDVTKTVSAFYNFIEVITASVNSYTGTGHIEFGRSVKSNGNFFSGEMHEARIWSKALTEIDLKVNSLTNFSGGESGLLAYYPMNEGKGTLAYDKANGSNATLTGNWATPPGKAVVFNDNGYLRLDNSSAPISSNMNYTIELWFKGEPEQKDAALASNGKGDGTDAGGSQNLFFLGFEDSLLTYVNSGFKIQAEGHYLDNNWHHIAVAVDHVAGTARIFVDGEMKQYAEAANPGGISSAIYLGARTWLSEDSATQFDRYFKGSIDEFRVWNTYLDQTLINKNNNVRLNADEFGLKLYYPFETYITSSSGITTLDSSWQDMAATSGHTYAYGKNASYTDITAPIKNRGPVSNLSFDYVVSNDAIVINMQEQKAAIDKTIVTFSVNDALDKHGNPMASPVTWTAYINQNPLQWSDDELNLSKDASKPTQFESYVINNGGSNQHFTITNLPKWLSADITIGELAPLEKRKITFTINERTNTGAYNEVLYLHNSDNQTDNLSVNLTVKGKEPNWVVDPGAYKYNMAVYGKMRINNVFSASNEDRLAAFINGKCVGVTNNTYNSANDLWYAFLTVYSNSVTANNLEFRIWQASTGKIYQATPAQTIQFKNDAITGSASDPVIFDGKEMIFEDIDLNKGWNWISFNVNNTNFNNVNTALLNGKWSSGDIVKHNDIGFDQYASASGWMGTLPSFNNTSMYMLSTANAQTLSMLGTTVDVSSTAIPLKGGKWSYVSYLPGVNLSVKQALAGYNPTDGDVIKSQTGFAMYNTQNGWIGSLTYLQPGKGYMFYRKNATDTSFYYPVNVDPLDGLRSVNDHSIDSSQTTVPANFNYANNMTMIAVLNDAYRLQPGDMVIAHSAVGKRGKAQTVINPVTNSGALFFNIAAEDGEGIYFTLERNNNTIATSDMVIVYRTDSRVGSLSAPFVINMRANNTIVKAYPNPFQSNVNITVDLPAAEATSVHEVYVSVYNLAGKLLLNSGKQIIYNGHYQFQWNGTTASGQACAAGVYIVNVLVDSKHYTYKIIKN